MRRVLCSGLVLAALLPAAFGAPQASRAAGSSHTASTSCGGYTIDYPTGWKITHSAGEAWRWWPGGDTTA